MGMKLKKKALMGLSGIGVFFSLLLFQNFTWTGTDKLAGAKQCSSDKLKEILAKATDTSRTVKVDCSFTLRAQDVVTKGLVLEGAAASGVNIDCRDGSLKGNAASEKDFRILIASVKDASSSTGWSRPEKIAVNSCKIFGGVRVRGLGNNGEAADVRASSILDAKHTARAQAVAPRQIVFEKVSFVATSGIPLYIAPGSTQVTVQSSTFSGKSSSAAIYMDAESANNRIINNKFAIKTTRELIAVDGSAGNLISQNEFVPYKQPSIHIYRNCGEGGTVRHQTPQNNVISANTFYQDTDESIYIGSRNGRSSYCSFDEGYPFGSSKDDRDFADNNKIHGNQFFVNKDRKVSYISKFIIINNSKTTEISRNKINIAAENNLEFEKRVYGAYVDTGGNSVKKIPVPKVSLKLDCSSSSDNKGCLKTVACPHNKKTLSSGECALRGVLTCEA